jgi:hypothetical protein
MILSEILTIIVYFHQSNYRNFKHYYEDHVCVNLRPDFPQLVSYNRFLELMSEVNTPLLVLLQALLGQPSTANYIDSTKLDLRKTQRV